MASSSNTTEAYCVTQANEPLQLRSWTLPTLGDHDVEAHITHCGLCHTDYSMVMNLWGASRYPLCPGHEGIGIISQVGSKVTHLKVGDRVGFGWLRDSCGHCTHCISGEQNICLNGATILMGGAPENNGCFARTVRVKATFAFKIPEDIDSVDAGPLMCAGITMYTPLREYISRPGIRVGIIGIGGLGHLGIMLANKMGADVTAFSTTKTKDVEALKFGAHKFVWLGDEAQVKSAQGSVDVLINTSPKATDFVRDMGFLAAGGKNILVGIPEKSNEFKFSYVPLIFGQKSVCGSLVGGRRDITEMLEFCAVHKIKPQIEIFDFKDVNQAIEKCVTNKARYRIVLKF